MLYDNNRMRHSGGVYENKLQKFVLFESQRNRSAQTWEA
jgi:hypothetical protein